MRLPGWGPAQPPRKRAADQWSPLPGKPGAEGRGQLRGDEREAPEAWPPKPEAPRADRPGFCLSGAGAPGAHGLLGAAGSTGPLGGGRSGLGQPGLMWTKEASACCTQGTVSPPDTAPPSQHAQKLRVTLQPPGCARGSAETRVGAWPPNSGTVRPGSDLPPWPGVSSSLSRKSRSLPPQPGVAQRVCRACRTRLTRQVSALRWARISRLSMPRCRR